jgi:hypothetical protein
LDKEEQVMKNNIRTFMVLNAIFAHFALSGCGGGGAEPVAENTLATSPPPAESARNSYALTEDAYGLQNATFMSATRNDASIVLRAAIATSMTDPNFSTVFRIDIPQPTQVSGPVSYAIGGDGATIPKFPGEILVFNGHKSSLLNTASGTITFTSYGKNSGEVLAGNFAITVEDHNSAILPRPAYTIKGNFSFVLNTFGALIPATSPVPAAADGYYNAKCASCHALGSFDLTTIGAPDLALKGGEIAARFTADQPGHDDVTLSASEIRDLMIFLNAQ